MIKKFSLCIIMALLLLTVVSAHPGRTDSHGGHYDSETGEYHYHHGYAAHQHTDLNDDGIPDCPYDFDDKTGESSGLLIFVVASLSRRENRPSSGNK